MMRTKYLAAAGHSNESSGMWSESPVFTKSLIDGDSLDYIPY